jgi:hypothetical protein
MLKDPPSVSVQCPRPGHGSFRSFRHAARNRGGFTVETFLLGAYILLSSVARIYLIYYQPFNVDEPGYLACVFHLSNGLLPFIDFCNAHAPLLYKLFLPILRFVGERPDYLILFRWFEWFALQAFLLSAYFFFRSLFDARTALWSLFLLNTFQFFITRTVHFRPDLLPFIVLLATLNLFMRFREGAPVKLLLTGLGFGLAVAFHIGMVAPFLFTLLWHVSEGQRRGRFRQALRDSVGMGILSLLVFFSSYYFVFGSRIFEAVSLQMRIVPLAGYFLSFEDPSHTITARIIANSAATWILFALCSMIVINRWAKDKIEDHRIRLILFLTLSGFVYLLVNRRAFEHYYYTFILFGAALMALSLTHRELASGIRILPRRTVLTLTALVTALPLIYTVGWANYRRNVNLYWDRKIFTRIGPPKTASDGTLLMGPLKSWIATRQIKFANPYSERDNRITLSRIEFLLKRTQPQDVVFTDWLTPPFRRLPNLLYTGVMTSRFNKSKPEDLTVDILRMIQRYDPAFEADAKNEVERTIHLFDAANVKLILLEGTIGSLFLDSPEFRDWLMKRFRIVYDPGSYSLFALRLP